VSKSLFRHVGATPRLVEIMLDDRAITLPEGEMLAAALLAAGHAALSDSIVAGAPRGPLCLMGSCFQCVAEIDGQPQTRACRTPVRAGLRVRRVRGAAFVRPPDPA
jgi:predicted molibdopterin-dependent oxidoreductase YjgC